MGGEVRKNEDNEGQEISVGDKGDIWGNRGSEYDIFGGIFGGEDEAVDTLDKQKECILRIVDVWIDDRSMCVFVGTI